MSSYFSLGECNSDIRVYSGGTCFKTRFNYDNFEVCRIDVLQDIRLQVGHFATEQNWDFLIVNNRAYSGTNGPDGVFVEAGEQIAFYSDWSITDSGFDICGVASSSGSSSLIGTNEMPLIFGSLGCLCIVCIVLFRNWLRKLQKRKQIGVIVGRVAGRHDGEDLVIEGLPGKPGVGITTPAEQSVEGAVEERCRSQNFTSRYMPSDYSMSFNLRPEFSSSENCYPIIEAGRVMQLADLEEEEEAYMRPSFTSLQLQDVDSTDLAPPDDPDSPPSYQFEEDLKQLEGARQY